ncbi:HET-domain-containing protein [Trematosphaeria pertusa]|uniref:HET-domain-containing protein n=1 Tax=Trematosphaeria pertusa TaxID=390896 RepID=A0A6A6I8R7_9PLEO|nr:HET-domain-containing protein [Trematosphaeria pertusa]KAF2246609.1 HET-domain-containing protein [Trematosphaeria pertusa]
MVCKTCKGLQESDPASSVEWVNTGLPSLRQSSTGGCRACTLLLQGILLHHDRFAGVKEESIHVVAQSFDPTSGKNAQDHLSVEVRWKEAGDGCCAAGEHKHDDGYPDLKLEFFTDQDGQSSFSAIGRGRHISENPLQDAGLSAARSMINTCLSSHSRCRHIKPTTLPRRVVDVLLDDPAKGVRLHESEFDDDEQRYEYGEYLALSHCWGTGRGIPKTTKKTLQAHKKLIPWASLPRTFQEAVVLTRSRGFRYLWVDSLCVVQDDPADKLEESLSLDEIFGNAFLTMAATSAADSSKGLFQPRPQPFKIQATDSKGSLSKIYVREQPSHYSFKAPFNEGAHMNDWELPFNTSEEANLHTPLLKRAWAYTERLLSPRVLHFTKSEMILECREGYQCECGRIDNSTYDSRTTDSVKQEFARVVAECVSRGETANSNGNDRRIDSVASQLAATSLADVARDLNRNRDDALQLWSYIVTEYTARNLTYDADRLVAIASVAKALFETLKSGYIAGQWTCSTLGMLWYPNDSMHCRRPKANAGQNVPTWSWASVEGSPIFFDNSSAMDLACNFSVPSGAAWSPTTGDRLELTASMATEVTFRIDSGTEFSLVKNGVSAEFRPDVIPPRGEDAMETGDTLLCVFASMTFRSSIIGLVLKQSRSNTQLYRRVGRFECYECQRDGSDEEPEDAECLFEYWFPEVEDMTQLDDGPQRTFIVV